MAKTTKKDVKVVKCTDCMFADLHQWFVNPIISICSARKGERFVAECGMACERYKKSNKVMSITHHDKYD